MLMDYFVVVKKLQPTPIEALIKEITIIIFLIASFIFLCKQKIVKIILYTVPILVSYSYSSFFIIYMMLGAGSQSITSHIRL